MAEENNTGLDGTEMPHGTGSFVFNDMPRSQRASPPDRSTIVSFPLLISLSHKHPCTPPHQLTMIPVAGFFENAEISIVPDNAKTHQPKPKPEDAPRRNGVKRTKSLPMDLNFGSDRRRRRARRGSAPNLPPSRWSAEPSSPTKMKKHNDVLPSAKSFHTPTATSSPPPCVLRNVLKPVRQDSRENLGPKASPCLGRRHSLMPTMPVRQQSLRELVGCSPNGSSKVDTVDLITQALEQLASLSEEDEEMMIMQQRSPMSSSSSLPSSPSAPL